MLAQQSWALTYSGDPRGGEAAATQALAIAEESDDAALTLSALTSLLVATGRQGRYDEALAHARRAAALAGRSADSGPLPLQPKLFLGLALFDCDLVAEARAVYREALDDEFGSGWWLSDTLMADAQASFVVGEWDDAVPRLLASGQAARDKNHPLLESQALAYRAIIATATGDHRAATELVGEIAGSLAAEPPSYNAGIITYAVAGLMAVDGDQVGAYEILLRRWREDAATENRFYQRCLAPDLVRLALALGHRELGAEVAESVAAGAFLAPDVPTVRSLALRCRGLVDVDPDAMLEAVAIVRRVPHLVEHGGTCEDAASVLAGHGRVDEAAALLTEALERYEGTGATAWASRVRSQLRDLGVHPGQRGIEEPSDPRLGEPHRHGAERVPPRGRGADERRRGPTAVHVAAHCEHAPAPCFRQARRVEPGGARRRRPSLDRVMSPRPTCRTMAEAARVGSGAPGDPW